MNKPNVFLTRTLPEPGMQLLQQHTNLITFEHDRQITKDEILQEIPNIEGLVCLLTDPIDCEVIEAAPNLKVISSYAVGYNNIDIEAAKKRSIAICNTPGVLTEATADIAFALLISVARRIVESDAWLRMNTFEGWAPKLFRGLDLVGKTLGIIGAGRIGKALAKRAHFGFDMNILYHNRNRDAEFENACGAQFTNLEALLKKSDFISIHTPLTPETHHLVGERELSLMKQTAVFINTARGPVVDEQALIHALQKERIFGAGFDVFENEPHVPEELKALPNVVILPHIGSASFETRDKMSLIAAENCIAILQGKRPEFRVV